MCTLTAYMHELWFISIEMSALTVHLNFAAVPQTQSLRLWFDAVYFYIAATAEQWFVSDGITCVRRLRQYW